jgi:hypothetical protein
MKHETHSLRLTRHLQNYSEHAGKRLKGSKRGFDWGSLDSPKKFATSTFVDGLKGGALIFATGTLCLAIVILMSRAA